MFKPILTILFNSLCSWFGRNFTILAIKDIMIVWKFCLNSFFFRLRIPWSFEYLVQIRKFSILRMPKSYWLWPNFWFTGILKSSLKRETLYHGPAFLVFYWPMAFFNEFWQKLKLATVSLKRFQICFLENLILSMILRRNFVWDNLRKIAETAK